MINATPKMKESPSGLIAAVMKWQAWVIKWHLPGMAPKIGGILDLSAFRLFATRKSTPSGSNRELSEIEQNGMISRQSINGRDRFIKVCCQQYEEKLPLRPHGC